MTDANKDSNSGPGGQPPNTDEFMTAFHSAVSQLPHVNASGTHREQPPSPRASPSSGYGEANFPANLMGIVPAASRRSGYNQGLSMEELVGLTLLASSLPPTRPEDTEYEEESEFESDQDHVRMSRSRTMRSRTPFGNISSRSSLQMMMGSGGFGMRATRSSNMQPGRMPLLGMIQLLSSSPKMGCLIHGPDCPHLRLLGFGVEGSSDDGRGFTDDGYDGPVITEMSDDETTVNNGEMLALPPSSKHKMAKVNKNAVLRKSKTGALTGATNEKKYKRKRHDTRGTDNRYNYHHDEEHLSGRNKTAQDETSNIWKFDFKADSLPHIDEAFTEKTMSMGQIEFEPTLRPTGTSSELENGRNAEDIKTLENRSRDRGNVTHEDNVVELCVDDPDIRVGTDKRDKSLMASGIFEKEDVRNKATDDTSYCDRNDDTQTNTELNFDKAHSPTISLTNRMSVPIVHSNDKLTEERPKTETDGQKGAHHSKKQNTPDEEQKSENRSKGEDKFTNERLPRDETRIDPFKKGSEREHVYLNKDGYPSHLGQGEEAAVDNPYNTIGTSDKEQTIQRQSLHGKQQNDPSQIPLASTKLNPGGTIVKNQTTSRHHANKTRRTNETPTDNFKKDSEKGQGHLKGSPLDQREVVGVDNPYNTNGAPDKEQTNESIRENKQDNPFQSATRELNFGDNFIKGQINSHNHANKTSKNRERLKKDVSLNPDQVKHKKHTESEQTKILPTDNDTMLNVEENTINHPTNHRGKDGNGIVEKNNTRDLKPVEEKHLVEGNTKENVFPKVKSVHEKHVGAQGQEKHFGHPVGRPPSSGDDRIPMRNTTEFSMSHEVKTKQENSMMSKQTTNPFTKSMERKSATCNELGTGRFNKLVKSHLPTYVTQKESDDILSGNPKQRHSGPNVDTESVHSLHDHDPGHRDPVSTNYVDEQLDATIKGLVALADGASTYIQGKSNQTRPRTTEQKNASPGLNKTTKSSACSDALRRTPGAIQTSSFGESKITSPEQASVRQVGRFTVMDDRSRKNQPDKHRNCVHQVIAYKCGRCDKVHISCDLCKQKFQTICGKCVNCERELSNYPQQGYQNFNVDQTGSVDHNRHYHPANPVGAHQSYPNIPFAYPHSVSHHASSFPQGQIQGQNQSPNFSATYGAVPRTPTNPNKDGSTEAVYGDSVGYQGSIPQSYSYDPLEEQHSIDDHLQWQTIKDTLNMATPPIPPPKKPVRNKNLTVRKSQIQKPNFTASARSSSQNAYRDTNESSAYQSDYYDRLYGRQGASSDRLTQLSEMVLQDGMVVKDVYPDGNCFFAAIVDQLRVRGEFFYTVKSLRKEAVKYLREHPNQEDGTPLFEFVSNHDDSMTWEQYLKRLARDGEWADHIIISAIANVLNRRVMIHSVLRTGQNVNKTILEPDLKLKSRAQRHPIEMTDAEGHSQSKEEDDKDGGNVEQYNENDEDDKLLEDLQLGHIPEAHYVSLRYVDWEDKLYENLRSRKDNPSTQLTDYGPRKTRKNTETFEDSNEDLVDPTSFQRDSHLPDEHLNFLFKYIRDGHFLESCHYNTHKHPHIPGDVKRFFTSWGVGDRYCDIESYLVTDPNRSSTWFHDKEGNPLVWYMAFPYDTIVSKNDMSNEVNRLKQLIPHEEGCELGFLKLKPANPRLWGQQLRQEGDVYFLKHLYLKQDPEKNSVVPVHITFQCDWPNEALECKKRMMKFRPNCKWGIEESSATKDQKIANGVRALPVCSEGDLCHDPDCTEWQYSFSVLEYVICEEIITSEARFCFKIMDHFLKFIFNDKTMIKQGHIKTVFFYTCDELDIGIQEPNLIEIMSHFLRKLEGFLKNGNIPDFFMRSKNLIKNYDTTEIAWHFEKLRVVNEEYMIYMFLFLDQRGIMGHFGLSKCFDGLLFDAHRPVPQGYRCFERLTVMEAREWVMASSISCNFSRARALIVRFTHDESSGDEDDVNSDVDNYEWERIAELNKQVLVGLPLQEQWLYAFYLEFTTGWPFLEHICKQHTCVNLKEFFGDSMMEVLASDGLGKLNSCNIELPNDIAKQEGVANFAVHFACLLKIQINSESAYTAAIHYFLLQYTDILLNSFSQGDNDEGRISFPTTLKSLLSLFDGLYSHYYYNRNLDPFSGLMEPYGRLCDYEPSVCRYEKLAERWEYFGDTYKSQEAMMKASSLRNNRYVQQTTL